MTEDDDLEALPPEEEAAIRAMLAALPDPQLPADVARQIGAAVAGAQNAARAEADAQEPDPSTPPVPPVAAPAHASHAATPPPGRWRRPWLLQTAAVLVIFALIGAVVVGFVSSRGDDAPADVPLALSQQTTGPVTTSGRIYAGTTLAGQVRGLVVGASSPNDAYAGAGESADGASAGSDAGPLSAADQPAKTGPEQETLASSSGGSEKSTASGDTQQEVTGTASGAVTWSAKNPDVAKVTALVTDPKKRQACIDQLASVPGALPVAVDAGVFEGKPAAVFVLADESDPTKVAVWVVGPNCSSADTPFPYRYERVTRP